MIKNLFCFVVLFFFGCGAGVSDSVENLGNGYYYLGEGPSSNIIYKCNSNSARSIDNIIIYPQVDHFTHDERYIVVNQRPSLDGHKMYLGFNIENIASGFKHMDSIFSFSGRIPQKYKDFYKKHKNDTAFYRMVASRISPNNTIEDQNVCAIIADSILRSHPYYQALFSRDVNYWIIDKKYEETFGPFSKEDYRKKKIEIGVSINLIGE